MKNVIVINRALCLKCGDIITSKHVHDFKYCSCKNVAVDGGNDYIRRLFENLESYLDLNEYISGDENYEVSRNAYGQNDLYNRCCTCNSKDIVVCKGNGEFISGLDLIGYICNTCKSIYVFKDTKFITDCRKDVKKYE